MRIIVEGLDGVGKTTIARFIAAYAGARYHKVPKRHQLGRNEVEVTQRIVDDVAASLGEYWDGVLDRGYWSAVGTGMSYDASLHPEQVVCPAALYKPDVGLVVSCSKEIVLGRLQGMLSQQDRRVIERGEFFNVQERLLEYACRAGYVQLRNVEGLDVVRYEVERLLEKCGVLLGGG